MGCPSSRRHVLINEGANVQILFTAWRRPILGFILKLDLKWVIKILETIRSNKLEPIYKIECINDLNVCHDVY